MSHPPFHPASSRRTRRFGLIAVLLVVLISRWCAHRVLGVHFDSSTLGINLQFIDPELLKADLARSLYFLRDQPPLFNACVGMVLKVAPTDDPWILGLAYSALGWMIAATLYLLLCGFGASTPVAAVVTALFMLHPTTILYENWLMYEYPLAALLTASAWLLHLYIAHRRPMVGALFFTTLALIVLTRGTFHLVWMLGWVMVVALISDISWKNIARVSAVPILVAGSLYAKNAAVFGDLLAGDVYRKINYVGMTAARLPRDELQRLYEQGRLSKAYALDFYSTPVTGYSDLLPPITPTGVPLLDNPKKSTGAVNWHHQAMPLVADLYYQSAVRIAADRPELYRSAVMENLERYFQPADETRPFSVPQYSNAKILRGSLTWSDRLFAGQFEPGAVGWILVVTLPLLALYGIWRSTTVAWRRWRARRSVSADEAALAAVVGFCAFNATYVALTTIALSYADHNRYRFSTMPLYVVLAGALTRDIWSHRAARAARDSSGSAQPNRARREAGSRKSSRSRR